MEGALTSSRSGWHLKARLGDNRRLFARESKRKCIEDISPCLSVSQPVICFLSMDPKSSKYSLFQALKGRDHTENLVKKCRLRNGWIVLNGLIRCRMLRGINRTCKDLLRNQLLL